MYKALIRPLLFLVDPERIHHFVFRLLYVGGKIPGMRLLWQALYTYDDPVLEQELFGIRFRNPIGLAAGFDKDARLTDELSCFGFGFIEIGTVTPLPQDGNPRPRLFRLPADGALINRMGFNNAGAASAAKRLKLRASKTIVGGNIGKNKITSNDNAWNDYAKCFDELYPYVHYFVVNVSSPNTPGLRALQEKEPLRKLLDSMKRRSLDKPVPKPVLLKVAPDLSVGQLDDIISILKETHVDGVIATNTTISRAELQSPAELLESIGQGGLSGRPLTSRSTEVIRYLRSGLGPNFPIIGVGGIMTAADALEKLNAGADLIQLYTGFIYEGPSVVSNINKVIARERRRATHR
jgi:dihydroorotate dehydrogenase